MHYDNIHLSKKIVLIENLHLGTLPFAIIYRLKKTNALYLNCTVFFMKPWVIEILKVLGILMLDYEKALKIEKSPQYSGNSHYEKKVYEVLFDSRSIRDFGELFDSISNAEKKLKIVLCELISKRLGSNFYHIKMWESYFQTYHHEIILLLSPNPIKRILCNESGNTAGLFFLQILSIGKWIKETTKKKIIRCLYSLYALLKAIGFKITSNKETDPVSKNELSKFEILFFPHDGIYFGDLFAKDHFYNDKPGSHFNRRNILHLEWTRIRKSSRTYRFYQKHEIPYLNYKALRPKTKSWSRNAKLFFLNSFLTILIPKRSDPSFYQKLLRYSLFFDLYKKFSNNVQRLSHFKNAKLALVGYDYLFPRILSLSLNCLNIKTIAVQERINQTFYSRTKFIFDYYFVSGSKITERLNDSDFIEISNIIEIGQIRLDTLFRYKKLKPDAKISAIKKKYHIILALDFYSIKNRYSHRMNPGVNWESNRLFYKDLIKLAIANVDYYIIIRGKDDKWCSIPAFRDLYDIIQTIPNIHIDRNYDRLNVSYELAAAADVVIAKYTSLAEECLAAGIPVIFHEYARNTSDIISRIRDFDKLPVFAFSFEELSQMVKDSISASGFEDKKRFDKLRKKFYGTRFDGKVKERLQLQLESIFLNSKSPNLSS